METQMQQAFMDTESEHQFFSNISKALVAPMLAASLIVGSVCAIPAVAKAQDDGTATIAADETPIRITVGDVVMTGRLNATTMAQRMAERLPVTLTFVNHPGGGDYPTKVSHLDPPLDTEGTELGAAPGIGDIAHYVPNGNFGFYYGQLQHWPGAVVLGSFDGDPNVFAQQTEPFSVMIEARTE